MERKTEKLREIDDKDRRIINILSENSREKLTSIARKVGISVDATKKRVDRLIDEGTVKPTIVLNFDAVGLHAHSHVYIKIAPPSEAKYDELITYLKKHPRVLYVMFMLGDYDIYIVLAAKDTKELGDIKHEIRQKFPETIADWKELLVSGWAKYEEIKI
jgi:DNA-binding Lrp family transcriptional regulator